MSIVQNPKSALDGIRERFERTGEIPPLHLLLPMFRLKGDPYDLDKAHYMFKPMFRVDHPRKVLYKTARQVGKTQQMAASKVLRSVAQSNFNVLLVCPRFEQIKRISNNYVKPLLMDSPYRDDLIRTGNKEEQSVLQRTFSNGSIHYYSFAFLDAERIRSISCNDVAIDEVQDMNWDFIPVIAETMSGSPVFKHQLYLGTPKTMENTIEKLWGQSSQAEWITKCMHCNLWNIPAPDHHLLKMIGKLGVVCARCGKPLDLMEGSWEHFYQDRLGDFVGYHIPQIIHPFHYRYPQNWKDLVFKLNGGYPMYRFMNECCGVSFDSSIKLMTETVLKQIQLPEHPNTLASALLRRSLYGLVAIGIDWGGGGSEGESYTAVVVAGQRAGHDTVEVLYATKLSLSLSPTEETVIILDLIKRFNPNIVSHDYGGAGNLREVMLIQAGVPMKKVVPFTYVFSTDKRIIYFQSPERGSRRSYSIDKPRSLITLCTMMKAGKVRIPEWESSKTCFEDFLNLIEDRQERPRGSDVVLITKAAGTVDDICHALNFACSSIWYSQQRYPNLAEALRFQMTAEEIALITPPDTSIQTWES